jgi:hypothetical protein
MKKIILFGLFLGLALTASTQVWAPAGATWHYDYAQMWTSGYVKIQYVNDTTIAGKTCQVLKKELYTYDWLNHTFSNGVLGYDYTYSENNVVYLFRFGQFYTLYDFNAVAGNSWQVPGWDGDWGSPCDTTGTVVVDSTGTTNINGFPLKYIWTSPMEGSGWSYYNKIIERIGSLGYMFPEPICIVDVSEGGPLRCYYDDAFGLYMRPGFEEACDFIVGIEDIRSAESAVAVYPLPAGSAITVDITTPVKGDISAEISDITGKSVIRITTSNPKFDIDIAGLKEGLYFIRLSDKGGVIGIRKIIKSVE